jgi:hypothetical protein
MTKAAIKATIVILHLWDGELLTLTFDKLNHVSKPVDIS